MRTLWSGIDLEVVSTAWRRGEHPERSEGSTSYDAIEVMHSGAFELRVGEDRFLADPGMVVFHGPDEPFSIRHPVGRANAGTTLRIGSFAAAELAAHAGRPARPGALFRNRVVPSSAGFVLSLQRFLAGIGACPYTDPLAREERVVEWIRSALELDQSVGGSAGSRPSRSLGRAELAQAFLNERWAQPVRLSDVARAARCSVWHVCKEFRRATGSSIHQWLVRLRLRHALEALRRGAEDLSQLALETGFSSHSHFAAAFRREFGITPRAARESMGRRLGTKERDLADRSLPAVPPGSGTRRSRA